MGTIRETLASVCENAYLLEPEYCDEAIIGISTDGQVIYSYNKLVEAMSKNEKWTWEEAVEWIDYNTLRSLPYLGDRAPIILTEIDQYE